MLKGKRGFERLLRAADQVFYGVIEWVFCDLTVGYAVGVQADHVMTLGGGRESVEVKETVAQTCTLQDVLVPVFCKTVQREMQDEIMQLLEWICLTAVASPRVQKGDLVDEIISRYQLPESATEAVDVLKMEWKGLLTVGFVVDLFARAVGATKESWFAVVLQGQEADKSIVVLKTEDARALTWECAG
jgi:ribonuclease P/MRP protein subunit RPP40